MTIENMEKVVAPSLNSQSLILNTQLPGSLDRSTMGLLFYTVTNFLSPPELDKLSLGSKGVSI
jgi:hypothetical protein